MRLGTRKGVADRRDVHPKRMQHLAGAGVRHLQEAQQEVIRADAAVAAPVSLNVCKPNAIFRVRRKSSPHSDVLLLTLLSYKNDANGRMCWTSRLVTSPSRSNRHRFGPSSLVRHRTHAPGSKDLSQGQR